MTEVCASLARQLVADAEGAHHDIAVEVRSAASVDDALEVARSVARNNLFKCAVFGNDPNWGRVLAAVGTTRRAFDPASLDVAMNGIRGLPVRRGGGGPLASSTSAGREVRVVVDLHAGDADARRSGPTTSRTTTSTRTPPTPPDATRDAPMTPPEQALRGAIDAAALRVAQSKARRSSRPCPGSSASAERSSS